MVPLPRPPIRPRGGRPVAVPFSPAESPPPPVSAIPRTPHPGSYNPQPVLEEGSVLAGRYEIVKTLGEGGMGAVYKAQDLELDRAVALKVIRPGPGGNPAILARFKQELILARQVTHRNIIRIYDLGEAEGVKFITMEFIEGEDLRTYPDARRQAHAR